LKRREPVPGGASRAALIQILVSHHTRTAAGARCCLRLLPTHRENGKGQSNQARQCHFTMCLPHLGVPMTDGVPPARTSVCNQSILRSARASTCTIRSLKLWRSSFPQPHWPTRPTLPRKHSRSCRSPEEQRCLLSEVSDHCNGVIAPAGRGVIAPQQTCMKLRGPRGDNRTLRRAEPLPPAKAYITYMT